MQLKKLKKKNIALLDSIQKLRILISVKKNREVLYSVQLGIFKSIDVDFSDAEILNLKKLKTTKGTGYLIGDFSSYRKARAF